MGNPVVHFEIGTRDLSKSQEFYATMFDWKMQEAGPAAMISTGSESGIQGHMTALGHEPFKYTIFYVQVEDVEAAIAKAVSLGGKQLVPPIKIPTGTFAWIADLDGNTVGLFKPTMG